MTDCKPVKTTIEQGITLPDLDTDELDQAMQQHYQLAIGSLMYDVVEIRPDLAYAKMKLSKY
jgi:hypothetical protein